MVSCLCPCQDCRVPDLDYRALASAAVSPAAAAAAFAPAAGARVSVAAAAEHAVRGLVVLAQQHVHPVVAPADVQPASVVRVPVAVPVAAVAVVAVAAVAGVAVAQRDVL